MAEHERLATGPSMAELLAEADSWRASGGGLTHGDIVRVLHEARAERDDELFRIVYPSS